ncbi:MAG: hypothetical protein N2255_10365 [Kiritimatiellae bacterium]|nr:hypothetical protein [Kiritimatiellia bacterium]
MTSASASGSGWHKGLAALTLFLMVGLFATIFRLWGALIRAEYPLEYRENAMPLTTELMLRGRNPFDVTEQPGFANGYGLLYHWLVYPLARLGGAGFGVHRLVSAICLVLSTLLCLHVWSRDGVPSLFAWSCAAILITNLAFDVSSLARPDGLGLLLMVATVTIPHSAAFSVGSILLSALTGLAGFYTKPYFLFGLACVGTYLFLFVSMRKAVSLAGIFLLGLAVSVLVIRWLYPCYFTNIIYAQLGDLPCDWQHLFRHGGRFTLLNAGAFLLLVFTVLMRRRDDVAKVLGTPGTDKAMPQSTGKACEGRFLEWAGPLIPRPLWSYPVHLLVLGTAAVLWMGRHTGQGLLYYRQLFLPFLLWTCVAQVARWSAPQKPGRNIVAGLLIVFQLAALMAYALHKGPRLWKDRTAEWKEVQHIVETKHEIYHDAPLAHLVFARGKKVWDNGHTYLAFFVRPGSHFWVPAGYTEAVEVHLRDAAVKLANREFDCLALTPLNDGFFDALAAAGRNYRLAKKLSLPLPFNSEVLRLSIYEPVVEMQ